MQKPKQKQNIRSVKSRSGIVSVSRQSEKQLKEAAGYKNSSDSSTGYATDNLERKARQTADYAAKKLNKAVFRSSRVQDEKPPDSSSRKPSDPGTPSYTARRTIPSYRSRVPDTPEQISPSGTASRVRLRQDAFKPKSPPPISTRQDKIRSYTISRNISEYAQRKNYVLGKKLASKKADSLRHQSYKRLLRAIRESIHSFFLWLSSFFGTALLLVLIFAGFISVLFSGFGLFFSNETDTGNKMTELISKIDSDYTQGIERQVDQFSSVSGFDKIRVVYRGDGDGDSAAVNNWNDVLSVYAVLYTTDPNNASDVLTVKPDTEYKLSKVFHSMNSVSYDRKVTYVTDEKDPEKELKILTIYVNQTSLTYKEAAELYGFDQSQTQQLEELMAPAYFTYFADLVGVDVTDGENLTSILSGLPANSKGSEVVKAALTKLGAPYVMGAKGDRKFDCSGLVYWSIYQVDPALGSTLRTNAAGQAKYCYDRNLVVGESELLPGDLVFWRNLRCEGCHRWNEVHHTGIYIGNGKVIEASSSRGRVVIRTLWSGKYYPLFMFGRPY